MGNKVDPHKSVSLAVYLNHCTMFQSSTSRQPYKTQNWFDKDSVDLLRKLRNNTNNS